PASRARRRRASARHCQRDHPRRGNGLRARLEPIRKAGRILRSSQSPAARCGARKRFTGGTQMTAAAVRRDLDSPDPEVRRRAVAIIPDLAEADATDLVLRALGDGDWRVRKEASQIAFLLGPTPTLLDKLVG